MAFVLGVMCWVVLGMASGSGWLGFAVCVVIWGVGLKGLVNDPTLARTAGATPAKPPGRSAGTDERINPYNIPALMAAGDWATARLMLQKMAYTMPRESEETREQFKGLMKRFAVEDPLYASAVAAVRPIITAQPGIKQTELYPHMPTGSVEEARYVLYFAHELGDLVRVKKGNTYLVYPAGFQPPIPLPAPRRPRKPRAPGPGASA